jgi:hypothetical protein
MLIDPSSIRRWVDEQRGEALQEELLADLQCHHTHQQKSSLWSVNILMNFQLVHCAVKNMADR